MPIEAITNGESGSSVRAKLNSVISATNSAPTEVRPIAYGGTGAETAAAARVNLGTETVVPGVAQVITLTIESTPTYEWNGLYVDIHDGTSVCRFWVNTGPGDVPPTPAGGRLQMVYITGFEIIDVETAFLAAFSAQSSAFTATGSGTGQITVTNVTAAAAAPPAYSSPSLPIALSVSTNGVDSYRELPSMDGSQLYNVSLRVPSSTILGGVYSSEGSAGQFVKGLNTAGNLIYSALGTTSIANGGTGQTTKTAAFDALAPTTTKGDLIVHNGTDNIRVAVGGTNGHVLTVDSTQASGIRWIAPSGGGGGKVAQVVVAKTSTPVSTTSQIPTDNTIPQQTEGAEFLTATITPTNASSTLIIEFRSWGTNILTGNLQLALFRDSTANAIQATTTTISSGNFTVPAILFSTVSAGATTATTFKIRFGPNLATTSFMLRNNGTASFFGGVDSALLTITEILP